MRYVIDGAKVTSLEAFWDVIGEAVNGPGGYFGRNLDALGDCLSGGFGTPNRFTFQWRDHEVSRRHLGYPETVRQLELRLDRVHPDNRPAVAAELAAARAGRGPTVFDWLVAVFQEHPGTLELV